MSKITLSGRTIGSVKVTSTERTTIVKSITVGTPIRSVIASSIGSLNALNDVTISSAVHHDFIQFDSSAQKFVNRSAPVFTTIASSLIPSADSTHDLGSAAAKWRDLHLSGGTLNLGGLAIKDQSGTFSVADSTGTAVSFDLAGSQSQIRSFFSGAGDITFDSSTGQFSLDVEATYTKANFDSDFNVALEETALGGAGLTFDSASNTLSITNTGVDSAVYGSASHIPTVTINSRGQIDSAGQTLVAFDDDEILNFGANPDLQISHNSSLNRNLISAAGSGQVYLAGQNVYLAGTAGTTVNLKTTSQQGVEINYNSQKKFETTSTGVTVTGTVNADSATVTNISLPDNGLATFGTDGDFVIDNNGSRTVLKAVIGNLDIRQQTNNGDVTILNDDGSGGVANYLVADGSEGEVQLYHYGSQKLATKEGGVTVTGSLVADSITTGPVNISGDITFQDSDDIHLTDRGMIRFGDAGTGDFTINHNGTNTQLVNKTGVLQIIQQASDVTISASDGASSTTPYFRADGSTGEAKLNHYGNVKLTTKATGATVTGSLVADSATFTNLTRAATVDSATYGSATAIPVLTVNASGFIDSIGTVSVAGVSSTSFDSSTGIFTINTADGNSFTTHIQDSADLVRISRAGLSVTDAGGDGSFTYNSLTGVFTYTGPSASEVRAHITANKGVSIASGEINIDSANVRGMFSATDAGGDGSFSYNSGTGAFTYTGPSAAEVKAHFQPLDSNANPTFNQVRGPAEFIIDPAAIGNATGTVKILGNLQVEGTQTTINSTTVSINDKNIVIADSAADSSALNGGGITWGGSSIANTPSLTYDHANVEFDLNRKLNVSGDVEASTFSGSGASLTSLNASNLGSGTVPSARLSLSASDIPNLAASKITSGTFDSARIPVLSASDITHGTIDSARVPSLAASDIGTGTIDSARLPSLATADISNGIFDSARIPGLAAADIVTGTIDSARIPGLSASDIVTGTVSSDRLSLSASDIPNLATSKITSGTFDSARIPVLSASDIVVGTIDSARIPVLSAADIVTGTIDSDRIPGLDASDIVTGTIDSDRLPTGTFTTGGGGGLDSADLTNGNFVGLDVDSADIGNINIGGDIIAGAGAVTLKSGLTTKSVEISNGSTQTIVADGFGSVPVAKLNYNGSQRLVTDAYGVDVTGRVNTDSATIGILNIGVGGTGDSTSIITSTGLIRFTDGGATGHNISFRHGSDELLLLRGDGNVYLKSSGNTKLVTSTTGVTVTGTVNADSATFTNVSGNGSGLTSLPAGQLTGTIDSARLPGLAGSDITHGTIDSDRIPGLSAADVVTGTIDSDRLPINISTSGQVTTAVTATKIVANSENSKNAERFLTFIDAQSGQREINTDNTLTYHPTDNRITAGSFSGSGASLTSLPAGELTGTIDSARIPSLAAADIGKGTIDSARLPGLSTADIVTGTIDSARIPGLSTADIVTGTIDSDRIPGLSASDIVTGTIDSARIPGLSASDIVTGTIDSDRIPSLAAADISSGTIDSARIPGLSTADIVTGTIDSDRIPGLSTADIVIGTIDSARLPGLSSADIVTGTIDSDRIPGLSASDIVTGTIDSDRLPTGTFTTGGGGGGGGLDSADLTSGSFTNLNIDSAVIASVNISGGTISHASNGALTIGSAAGHNTDIIGQFGVNLKHAGATKLRTISTGVTVTGTINADSATFTNVSGNGSGLTSLPAGQLTGTIDSARIPSLAAADIGTGIIDSARIPVLSASDIVTGIIDSDRLPTGTFTTGGGGGGGGGATVSTTINAPGSPSDGDLWFDEQNGLLLIYYQDSDTAQWIQVTGGGLGLDSGDVTQLIDSDYVGLRTGSTDQVSAAATSSSDTQVFPLFLEAASTDVQSLKVDAGLEYNANTNVLTSAGGFVASSGGITTSDSAIFGGNGTSGGVIVADGRVSIFSGTGSPGYIDFYCESSNAHRTRIKSAAHADYTGNVDLTLPTTTGTIAMLEKAQTFTHTLTLSAATSLITQGNTTLGNSTSDDTNITGDLDVDVNLNVDGNAVIDGTIVCGNTVTATDFISTSDKRLKEDIETIQSALFKVENLRGVSYMKNNKQEIGVVAQEVETVMPEVVRTGEDGFKAVAYGNLVGLLIEAIKELKTEIDTIKGNLNGSD